jgi:hypothetical protein
LQGYLLLTDAFAVERWVNLGGGKGSASGRKKVMMVPERTPIFEVVAGNRGQEGAGFAPGGVLDKYQNVVSRVRGGREVALSSDVGSKRKRIGRRWRTR